MQDVELYIEIGKNVRRRRKEQILTQEALAESVESSSQYISRIERGQVGPSLEFLYKLACLFFDSRFLSGKDAVFSSRSHIPHQQLQ